MTDMPERIWVTGGPNGGSWNDSKATMRTRPPEIEYVRADLSPTRAQVEALVRPLEWTHHPCGEMAATGAGTAYIIDKRDVPRLRWLKWPNGHGPDRDGLDDLKAAAQADHTARILSALNLSEGGE